MSCLLALILASFGAGAAQTPVTGAAAATDDEFRAVWICYSDFEKSAGMNESDFTQYIRNMFDNVVALNMNTVVVHVRPFADAMYPSEYFPWSKYASGKQGVDPGYDPLKIMIREAHARSLKFHAWLNPYRVSNGSDVKALSKDNKARKYLTNSSKKDDRYVLTIGGKMYYNPSIGKNIDLIVNGIAEIVENYDVDGIHFDDYFYPDMGSKNYEKAFDAPEYNSYASKLKAKGKTPASISDWRRSNTSILVSEVYETIKDIKPNVVFGISPAGAYTQLDDDFRYCINYHLWLSEPGYIDYICPQVYWSFNSQNIFPYYETCQYWAKEAKDSHVKLYIGVPAYKMNTNTPVRYAGTGYDSEWYNQFTLAEMIRRGRTVEGVEGFCFFDYKDMVDERNSSAVKWLKETW